MIRLVAVCLLTALSAASHAARKELQVPKDAPGPNAAVISRRAPGWAETHGVTTQGNFLVFGSQGNPGLYLIPAGFGVAANDALIKKQNRAIALELGGILAIDLPAMLRSAKFAANLAPVDSADSPHFELIPLVYLNLNTKVKTKAQTRTGKRSEAKTLYVNCELHAHLMISGKSSWHARYQMAESRTFRVPEQVDIAVISGVLRECFDETLRLYAGHVEGRLQGAGRYKVLVASGGNYNTPLVESELPERIVIPDEDGLVEYPKSHLLREMPPLKEIRPASPRP